MSHDFVIDELGVQSDKVNNGETATVQFVADKVGTFEYYCSVGNHRAMGMVGKLIVTE
jgi:nitrite reductase (NO-forming)